MKKLLILDYFLYNLIGIVVHKGSTKLSGHYYTVIFINDKWYKFNDK